MQYNEKSFKFYVIADNAIDSGHSERGDALIRAVKASGEGFASVKVMTNPGKIIGLNPEKDESWIDYWLDAEEEDFGSMSEYDDEDDDEDSV